MRVAIANILRRLADRLDPHADERMISRIEAELPAIIDRLKRQGRIAL